ncbi:hypothetical protein AABB02_32500 [Streptomyces rimosus]|uniref:hypothetical protein n=1 Tax=Streptomyces rimosus TaxID=1927 RepID=UPI0031D45BF7
MRKIWFVPVTFLLGALLVAGAVYSFVRGDIPNGAMTAACAILAAVGGIYALKKGAPRLTAEQTTPVLLAVVIGINLSLWSGSPIAEVVAAAIAGLIVGLIARSRPSGKEL